MTTKIMMFMLAQSYNFKETAQPQIIIIRAWLYKNIKEAI